MTKTLPLIALTLFLIAPLASGAELSWVRSQADVISASRVLMDEISDTSWVLAYRDVSIQKIRMALTTDRGATWTLRSPVTTGDATPIGFFAIDSDSYILAYNEESNDDLLFTKTDDSGNTWTAAVTVSSTGDVGNVFASLCTLDSDSYIIVHEDRTNVGEPTTRWARSDDAGTTWTDTAIAGLTYYGANSGSLVGSLQCPSSTTWYFLACGIISGVEQALIVTTTDAGANWTDTNIGLNDFDNSQCWSGSLHAASATRLDVLFDHEIRSNCQNRLAHSTTTNGASTWSASVIVHKTDVGLCGAGLFFPSYQFPQVQAETPTRILATFAYGGKLYFGQSDNTGASWSVDVAGTAGIAWGLRIINTANTYAIPTTNAQGGVQVWLSGVAPTVTTTIPPLGEQDAATGLFNFATNNGMGGTGGLFFFGILLIITCAAPVGIAARSLGHPKAGLAASGIIALGVMVFNTQAGIWPEWALTVMFVAASASFAILGKTIFARGGD